MVVYCGVCRSYGIAMAYYSGFFTWWFARHMLGNLLGHFWSDVFGYKTEKLIIVVISKKQFDCTQFGKEIALCRGALNHAILLL